MNAAWHPDPLGRAELRYFDGTNWTHHVSNGGQQNVEPPQFPLTLPVAAAMPPMRQRKGGRLIAAGVLALISGTVSLLAAFGLFLLANRPDWLCEGADAVDCDQFDSSSVTDANVVAVLMMLLGILFIGAGVGACMRKHWGQVAVIALCVAGVLIQFVPIGDNESNNVVIPLLWFAVVAGLAIANNRAEYE